MPPEEGIMDIWIFRKEMLPGLNKSLVSGVWLVTFPINACYKYVNDQPLDCKSGPRGNR